MKKVVYLLAAAALAAACNGNGYVITGTVEGANDGDTVCIQKLEGRQLVKLDQAVIKNGKFKFTGKQEQPEMRYLTYNEDSEDGLLAEFFLEDGKISVQLKADGSVVSGTENNEIYQGFNESLKGLEQEMKDIYETFQDETVAPEVRQEQGAKLEELEKSLIDAIKAAVKDNIANAVGMTLLKQNYYYMDVDELDPLMAKIPADYDDDQTIVRIREMVAEMKKTAVGQRFTDVTLKTPEGQEVSLSDFAGKGKLVLVDFWASWCGPCRQEMPTLVEAYKKYKSKGLEIVGISLDKDADAWKKGIKDLNITWPQMSDLQYWNSAAAKAYAVTSIPHTVLISGDGTIIQHNLRGGELDQKLAELLK